MGLRIGGRVGPISVGTNVSGRETANLMGFFVGLVLIALAVLVVVTVAPVLAVGWGAWVLLHRPTESRRTLAIGAVIAGLVGAAFLWPLEYKHIKYYEEVPAIGYKPSVGGATRELAKAGFLNVEVRTEGERGGKSYCFVDRQQPKKFENADSRKPVILFEVCRPPLK